MSSLGLSLDLMNTYIPSMTEDCVAEKSSLGLNLGLMNPYIPSTTKVDWVEVGSSWVNVEHRVEAS